MPRPTSEKLMRVCGVKPKHPVARIEPMVFRTNFSILRNHLGHLFQMQMPGPHLQRLIQQVWGGAGICMFYNVLK